MIWLMLLGGPAQDQPINCESPMAQYEMNQCEAQDFARADAELNRLWRDVIAGARAADREINRDLDNQPPGEEVLRAAQRAWVTFRDAHCQYQSFEARGGSMQPMLYEGCRARLTEERIRQLRPEPTE